MTTKTKREPAAVARPLSPMERLQFAVESCTDPRAIKRAYAGHRVMRPSIYGRIVRAAKVPKLPARQPLITDARKTKAPHGLPAIGALADNQPCWGKNVPDEWVIRSYKTARSGRLGCVASLMLPLEIDTYRSFMSVSAKSAASSTITPLSDYLRMSRMPERSPWA